MLRQTISDPAGEIVRDVWYWESDRSPEALAIFLDGEFYVERMETPRILAELTASGLVPRLACAFLSHAGAETRHRDYTANAPFAHYLTSAVLPWLCRQSGVGPADCLLAGLSLSGLQAAYTAMQHPQVFTRVLCQSGSFWWESERLTADVTQAETVSGSFWISVGDQEKESGVSHPPIGLWQGVDQISAVHRFAQAIGNKGATVHYHCFQGGHDTQCWKGELTAALPWLLGPTKEADQ